MYSMSTICAFDHIEMKHILYSAKGCLKKFCSCLRDHFTNIFNFQRKKILLLTKEKRKLYQDATNSFLFWKRILKNLYGSKIYRKVRDHSNYTSKYRSTEHNIGNFGINVRWEEILVAFHNGSDYDYHFFIKELANFFSGWFECLGGNAEKY